MFILRDRLSDVYNQFDYILIDTPPCSTLLMMMGISAFENIIIPLDSGVFAFETLSTLKSLLVELLKEAGVETNLQMILLRKPSDSIFDIRQAWEIKKLVKGFLRENNMSQVRIFSIPFSRKIYRAQMKGLPVSHYAPFSPVGKCYKKIAREIAEDSGEF